MQICYALSFDEDLTFLRLAYISAKAVRRLHPQATVCVVLDSASLPQCPQPSSPLHPEQWADQVHVVECESDDLVGRNRQLKTQLRDLLTGPLLYLDADALPIASLEPIFEVSADFAAVLNRFRGRPYSHFPDAEYPTYEKLGWQSPTKAYYNGGVLYYADNDRTRDFAKLYQANWKAYSVSNNSFRDQAALNAAIEKSGMSVFSLPLKFNATVDSSPCFAKDAVIWHFFSRDKGPESYSLLAHLLRHLEQTGEIDWQTYHTAVERYEPWYPDADAYWKATSAYAPEQYLTWANQSITHADREAAAIFAEERFRHKPFSPRTWKMILRLFTSRSRSALST